MIPRVEDLRRRFPVSVRRKLPRAVEIVSLSKAQSRALNRRYRGKDAPTNVLSFRYGPDYGEIVLCFALIRDEARREGEEVPMRVTRMMVHAMVHLAGIHHETSPRNERRAAALEARVLSSLGMSSATRTPHVHGKKHYHSA